MKLDGRKILGIFLIIDGVIMIALNFKNGNVPMALLGVMIFIGGIGYLMNEDKEK